jgi:hypothetical protein
VNKLEEQDRENESILLIWFQVCEIQECDGPIYRTRVGDNSLMGIHSIINIIHNMAQVVNELLL